MEHGHGALVAGDRRTQRPVHGQPLRRHHEPFPPAQDPDHGPLHVCPALFCGPSGRPGPPGADSPPVCGLQRRDPADALGDVAGDLLLGGRLRQLCGAHGVLPASASAAAPAGQNPDPPGAVEHPSLFLPALFGAFSGKLHGALCRGLLFDGTALPAGQALPCALSGHAGRLPAGRLLHVLQRHLCGSGRDRGGSTGLPTAVLLPGGRTAGPGLQHRAPVCGRAAAPGLHSRAPSGLAHGRHYLFWLLAQPVPSRLCSGPFPSHSQSGNSLDRCDHLPAGLDCQLHLLVPSPAGPAGPTGGKDAEIPAAAPLPGRPPVPAPPVRHLLPGSPPLLPAHGAAYPAGRGRGPGHSLQQMGLDGAVGAAGRADAAVGYSLLDRRRLHPAAGGNHRRSPGDRS